jgi:alkaline phosphatase D
LQTRRQFVRRAGTSAAAVVFIPQAFATQPASAKRAPAFRGGRFSDGIMSGDPSTTSISLWTRLDEVSGAGTVQLEVARDKGFNKVVARQSVATGARVNHAIKARVTKLRPREEYYYRFSTRNAESAVGQFRTAPPADSKEPVKFAFFSCQDYTHGYYNAHEVLARGDYDFVICLGDYIYSETYHPLNGSTAVRADKIGRENPDNPKIVREAVTLADYRAKYSLYRSDKALRRVHSKFPMVMLWDDHEVQDNYVGGPSDGGLPAANHFSTARKRAGYRAFYESMPAFAGANGQRLYRSLSYGGLIDLMVMDQRRYRANQPCDDKVVVPCADLDQPRPFLGRPQMDFVKNGLKSSKAAWKVMANEVTVMPTRVLGGAYYTYDTWTGYPQEREELLTYIRDQQIKDVVFLTGDIHTFIAGDVRTGDGSTGDIVATELVGGSITSQSLGETNLDAGGGNVIKGNDTQPNTPPVLIDALRDLNPTIDNADFDHHGFGAVTATETDFTCQFVRMETIKKRTTKTLPGDSWRYVITRGNPSIKGQHGPPPKAA